jgi:hypothetical protein
MEKLDEQELHEEVEAELWIPNNKKARDNCSTGGVLSIRCPRFHGMVQNIPSGTRQTCLKPQRALSCKPPTEVIASTRMFVQLVSVKHNEV